MHHPPQAFTALAILNCSNSHLGSQKSPFSGPFLPELHLSGQTLCKVLLHQCAQLRTALQVCEGNAAPA